ncbi:hypothetical protein VTK73DRAFT_1251 [Phialemonium thermophilum]|uniref:Small EDRK-rich factor-like N-terminal domain-containing protein n=1 Tax=Phialemonium thermophilum TaxID=223376 RepID=A0ABR3Y4A5_9PEZI
MGNICGKPEPAAFSQPGRRLDSAPPAPATAPLPDKQQRRRTMSGGRTLGGSSTTGTTDADDARRKAAAAAEARAQESSKGGKLHNQLQAQKKKTMTETLKEASNEERQRRDMDANVEILSHN